MSDIKKAQELVDNQEIYELVKNCATETADSKNSDAGNAVFNISRKDYSSIVKSQGFTDEEAAKWLAIHGAIINAADKLNTEAIENSLNKITDNGKKKLDPKDDEGVVTSTVRINTPNGILKVANRSVRTLTPGALPGTKGENITIVNPVSINWRQKALIDKQARATHEDRIRAFFDL